MSEDQNIQRGPDGKFVPGASPNPGGKTKAWRAARKLIDARLNELVEHCVFMALHGSGSHMRMLLDRVFPSVKPGAEPVEVEGLADAKPEDRASVLIREIGRGMLDAETGAKLLNALSSAEQMALLEEIKRRVAATEGNRDLL